ncbi:type II secretion system protein [Euhalothece natronophila Z-M001]|uniref:Type II secretion system protein n=1 Tax=Euhalothece natronophila Z-M001 TaxID=522448 RepID=A0A5B8NK93_9CHRO|nr:type II secretion system protein [Euhalothece natronophila]QDZ39287.1 type II secretion system protein [Euhalothece natronophila Z-M001]
MKNFIFIKYLLAGYKNSAQGFTLLEVLVGIILITTFTLTAMQALVISTVFRVRSAEKSGATAWIQENVEEARFLGTEEQFNATEDIPDLDISPNCRDDDSCGEDLETYIEFISPSNDEEEVRWGDEDFYLINGGNSRQFLGDNDSGREVWLFRYTSHDDNTLELRYIAVLGNNNGSPPSSVSENDIVAAVNTEVVPDVAFDD